MALLVNETMQTGAAGQRTRRCSCSRTSDASRRRPGRLGADRARQRRPPNAGRGRAAAVPRARVLPRASRALGLRRSGLPDGRPRRASRAGPDRQAVRPAASNLRLRRARLRVLHLPPLRLGLRARLHRRPENPTFLWHEPGERSSRPSGPIAELLPLDLLLEEPSDGVEHAELRTRPRHRPAQPARARRAHAQRLPPLPQRTASQTSGDDDDDGEVEGQRRVHAVRRLRRSAGFGRSSRPGPPDQGRPAVPGACHAPDRSAAAGAAAYSTTSRRCADARCWRSPTRGRSPRASRPTCRTTRCGTSSARCPAGLD